MNDISSSQPAVQPDAHSTRGMRFRRFISIFMNLTMLILSVLLIVWISVETFEKKEFLQDNAYMTFQFWVCVFFLLDFFIALALTKQSRWQFFWHRIMFLLLSIPYLNIINYLHIELSPDALYFIRFIPLCRGALAVAIVMSYLSSDAVSSLFTSYLSIMLLISYFCSLIFFARESPVNPDVKTYWDALWWTAMNLTTVGCDISPLTLAGKIVAVIVPMTGVIVFPLFAVYLTNYVTQMVKRDKKNSSEI